MKLKPYAFRTFQILIDPSHSIYTQRMSFVGFVVDHLLHSQFATQFDHYLCSSNLPDNLLGKLFIDRMTDMSTLTQLEEFDAYWKEESSTVI